MFKIYSEYWKLVLLLFSFLFSMAINNAQTSMFNQFSNEFQLNRPISDRWTLELDFGNTFSNTPTENKIFKTLIQGYGMFWGHFYYSSRWKFSTSLFFYINHDVPEIGQFDSKEWRYGLQGIYFINKIRYTLSTRTRGEVRFITNEDGQYESTYRYRQMLKYIKPINSQVLRKGVFYAVAFEEIFFKSTKKEYGFHYFDRNMFTFGGGYMISNDLQIELTYSHEFIPRDNGNTINNLFTFTITTNNLVNNLRNKINNLFIEPDDVE